MGRSGGVLSVRALNRATLARQLLLERSKRSASSAIEHLVGMQAQAPNAPYVGLWTRLTRFRHEELATLVSSRGAVRTPLMRATIHLVTASDCFAIRPVVGGAIERALYAASPFGKKLVDVDTRALVARGRELLDERPLTRPELGERLRETWATVDAETLAYAVTYLLAAVQVPPRGLWGASGAARWAATETWLGRPFDADDAPDALVVRYLRAFGPATYKDAQAWSGLRDVKPVLERLRPKLRTFRDESGDELFDVPSAPRPDPDTPAPPRFLPEYDNVLLSHADRARVIRDGRNVPLPPGNGGAAGTVLVDGFYAATWKLTRSRGMATVHVEPFATLTKGEAREVEEEAARLLDFVAPDAERRKVELRRTLSVSRRGPQTRLTNG